MHSNCLVIQAESALEQMDWIEKITGVIASLLSSQSPDRVMLPKSGLLTVLKNLLSFVVIMI